MANTAKARYEQLRLRRDPFLRRARDYAALTLPSLIPQSDGKPSGQNLPEPYQGLGSRAVINLSSRLLTALLPPGQPFFRLDVPAEILIKSGQMSAPEEVQRGLALSEQLVIAEIERKAWRQPTNLTLQLLIVTGNALEQILPDNRIRVYRLDQFAVVRDAAGNLLEIVIQECLAPMSLPPEAQSLLSDKDKKNPEQDVELYTWIQRQPNSSWKVHQEVNSKTIPGSQGTFAPGELPFAALRWSAVPGEDYGRGKVEEHIGDLRTYESLSKAVLDGAAMAARNLFLVRPNASGTNLRKKIADSTNGDALSGNIEDVHMLQFANASGLQIAQVAHQTLKEDLAGAFLLNSGMRRDAERVTATEMRMMAEELEGTLGGVYSMLSEEMMRNRLQRLMIQMQRNQQLPPMKGQVEPKITVGLEALSRQQDVIKVQTAAALVAGLAPETQDYVDWPALLSKAFTGLGLPSAVRSEEDVAAMREQRAMMEAMAQGVGGAVQGAGQAMMDPNASQ